MISSITLFLSLVTWVNVYETIIGIINGIFPTINGIFCNKIHRSVVSDSWRMHFTYFQHSLSVNTVKFSSSFILNIVQYFFFLTYELWFFKSIKITFFLIKIINKLSMNVYISKNYTKLSIIKNLLRFIKKSLLNYIFTNLILVISRIMLLLYRACYFKYNVCSYICMACVHTYMRWI